MSMSQCKHLASSCATCAPLAPLGPLGRSGVNHRGLFPNVIWQMDVIHYPAFGNLRYIHTCCGRYFLSLCIHGGHDRWKASHIIKSMKSAMLLKGVPWALKTDNDLLTHLSSSAPSYPHGGSVTPLGYPVILKARQSQKGQIVLRREHLLGLPPQNPKEIRA